LHLNLIGRTYFKDKNYINEIELKYQNKGFTITLLPGCGSNLIIPHLESSDVSIYMISDDIMYTLHSFILNVEGHTTTANGLLSKSTIESQTTANAPLSTSSISASNSASNPASNPALNPASNPTETESHEHIDTLHFYYRDIITIAGMSVFVLLFVFLCTCFILTFIGCRECLWNQLRNQPYDDSPPLYDSENTEPPPLYDSENTEPPPQFVENTGSPPSYDSVNTQPLPLYDSLYDSENTEPPQFVDNTNSPPSYDTVDAQLTVIIV